MKRFMFNKIAIRHIKKYAQIFAFGVFLFMYSCNTKEIDPTPVIDEVASLDKINAEPATKWADMTLLMIRRTAGFSPPVAARALGYAGLTMYEAVVPGMVVNQSLAGQLNGLATLPKPETGKVYDWTLSLNAAQSSIIKNLFANTSDANKVTIDSLENALEAAYGKGIAPDVAERSTKFGQAVANAIFTWSKTDGGHEGYLRNFPTDYKVPVFPGSWQPTENGRKIPMQPYWGKNRLFVAINASLALPQPIAVSTAVTSQYFAQYLEVYTKNKALTQADKEVSVWWADDPSETFTPPGHSYNLAKIAVNTAKAGLGKAAESFARTGIAVTDAFTNCWKCKFVFNNERPYTFVRRAIDPNWIPFWPAPPFPGFTSGHATQSAANAIVLGALFGESFKFTDISHVGRPRDAKRNVDFKARTYNSFWESAEESAYSRFLGGIHTRQDNETGLVEGRRVGRNINALKWKK